MNDIEVSKLSRRDLLEILLDVEMENEALLKDQSRLRQQIIDLEDELQKKDSGFSEAGAQAAQAAALLQEARAAADNVAASQRENQAAQEQRFQEWERRLKEREIWLSHQEDQVVADAKRRADQILADAGRSADEMLRRAEQAASGTEERAASSAEKILKRAQQDSNAFWEDMNDLLKKRMEAEGGSNGR